MRAETEKERSRANLLRAVSHDLRTPLDLDLRLRHDRQRYDLLDRGAEAQALRDVCADAEWLNRMRWKTCCPSTRIDSGEVSVVKTPTIIEELVDTVLVLKFRKHHRRSQVGVDASPRHSS